MFIIKRDDGKIVGKSGGVYSYTTNIFAARIFNTKEEAERNLCIENEHIVYIGYNAILDNL